MSASFRPQLEHLDARDLPSVTPFSFVLSNGTLVSGSFDYANSAVDPALASQQVPVEALTVALNGQTATLPVQLSAPTATFALGQFQGLSLSAVAVVGAQAVFIDTTVALTSISVPTPIPVNPITPPPGAIAFDVDALVAAYMADLRTLSILQAQVSIKVTERTYLGALHAELVDHATNEPDAAVRFAYSLAADRLLAQIITKEGELYSAYMSYLEMYDVVQREYQFIRLVAPLMLGLPAVPAQLDVPNSLYQQYLDRLV